MKKNTVSKTLVVVIVLIIIVVSGSYYLNSKKDLRKQTQGGLDREDLKYDVDVNSVKEDFGFVTDSAQEKVQVFIDPEEKKISESVLDSTILDEGILASNSLGSFYQDFRKDTYEASLIAGRNVVLYFYDPGSLTGTAEDGKIRVATEQLLDNNTTIFRVDYTDSRATEDEKTIRDTLDVSEARTKIFFKKNHEIYRESNTQWHAADVLIALNDHFYFE